MRHCSSCLMVELAIHRTKSTLTCKNNPSKAFKSSSPAKKTLLELSHNLQMKKKGRNLGFKMDPTVFFTGHVSCFRDMFWQCPDTRVQTRGTLDSRVGQRKISCIGCMLGDEDSSIYKVRIYVFESQNVISVCVVQNVHLNALISSTVHFICYTIRTKGNKNVGWVLLGR